MEDTGGNLFGWNNWERHFGGSVFWERPRGILKTSIGGWEEHFRIWRNSLTWPSQRPWSGLSCPLGALPEHTPVSFLVQLCWAVSVPAPLSPVLWLPHMLLPAPGKPALHLLTWLMPNYPSDLSSSAPPHGSLPWPPWCSHISETGSGSFVHAISCWQCGCPRGSWAPQGHQACISSLPQCPTPAGIGLVVSFNSLLNEKTK